MLLMLLLLLLLLLLEVRAMLWRSPPPMSVRRSQWHPPFDLPTSLPLLLSPGVVPRARSSCVAPP